MKRFLSAFLVLLLLFGGAKPVSATAPTPMYDQYGAESAGVAINDYDSPLEVENTVLTFDIAEFPKEEYESDAAFLAYTGKLTAQYTIYNPTDTTITAKLLLPCFGQPEYGRKDISVAETYTVLTDGVEVTKTLRHSLGSQRFRTNKDLLWDTYIEDPFYSPDMPVTAYWFAVSDVDNEKYKEASVAIDLPRELGDRRFYLKDMTSFHLMEERASLRLVAYAKNEQRIGLYVIGEPLTEMPQWKFYQERTAKDSEQISGTATLLYSEKLTFQDLTLRNWREEEGISKQDWYNAVVEDINDNSFSRTYPAVFHPDKPPTFTANLMSWYEYEITVEPQQRVVNTVTVPVYPFVREGYEPGVYDYRHFLFTGHTWESFGKLDVVINTPYYLLDSMPQSFEKTDTGYKLSLDALHEDELMFQLCETDNPEKTDSSFNWAWIVLLAAPFLMLIEAFEAIGEFFTNLFQNLF
ncbi:MAG: hypothetical protein E7453_01810 [Ruminococcaceae bacterium]|nr:hypothetical protein [Oscillospiraceae bacterium]